MRIICFKNFNWICKFYFILLILYVCVYKLIKNIINKKFVYMFVFLNKFGMYFILYKKKFELVLRRMVIL